MLQQIRRLNLQWTTNTAILEMCSDHSDPHNARSQPSWFEWFSEGPRVYTVYTWNLWTSSILGWVWTLQKKTQTHSIQNKGPHLGVSKNSGTPKSSHFNRVFHYKPSILGYHYFWKHPFGFQVHIIRDFSSPNLFPTLIDNLLKNRPYQLGVKTRVSFVKRFFLYKGPYWLQTCLIKTWLYTCIYKIIYVMINIYVYI